jgi:hypothetical protein
MPGESQPPTHDIMPFPEGLDPATLEYVLSHLASVAIDFEFPAAQHQIDLSNPDSIDDFVHELEAQIKASQRQSAEKDAAIKILSGLINFYKQALEQTRNS